MKNEESDFDYLKKTIGPNSWTYQILEQEQKIKTWDLLQKKLKNCGTDETQKKAILKSFRYRNM